MPFFLELRSEFYKTAFYVFHYKYGLKTIVQIIVIKTVLFEVVSTVEMQAVPPVCVSLLILILDIEWR